MSEKSIEIYANPKIHRLIGELVSELRVHNSILRRIPIRIYNKAVVNELFYAENEILAEKNREIFTITLSDITPRKIVKDVLNIELHKALLYFTNKAAKAFRWHAGKIFYNEIETDVERSIYARLVDTVENKAIVEVNPKLSESFMKIFVENEVHNDLLDYMLSQAMLLPIISREYVVEEVDEEEVLAYMLATYGEEMLKHPTEEKGAQIAKELMYITKSLL